MEERVVAIEGGAEVDEPDVLVGRKGALFFIVLVLEGMERRGDKDCER